MYFLKFGVSISLFGMIINFSGEELMYRQLNLQTDTNINDTVKFRPGDNIQTIISTKPAGTIYSFAPGVYRIISPVVPKDGDMLLGEPGTAISGSKIISTWNDSVDFWYAKGYLPPPYKGTGTCEDDITNPCHACENVFRDGIALKRVMEPDDLTTGTFYADYRSNRIWIRDDPEGHLLEVAVAPSIINSDAENVTVKGIIIEKCASRAQVGAIQFSGSGWAIINCEVRFNHGTGIRDYGDNARIIKNRIHHNGQLGIGGNKITGTIMEGNEIAFNNTDGFWVMDWEGGGIKFCRASFTLRSNNIHDNLCVGVWCDIDCKGVIIESNSITNNAADGIRYEISYDAIIRNNVIQNNDWHMGRKKGINLHYGGGINIHTSSNVEIYGNSVSDNLNGIGLVRTNRGKGMYGTWDLVNVKVHNNFISMTNGVTGLLQNIKDDS